MDMYVDAMDDGKWTRVCKTETIQDQLNPQWVTPVTMDYFFEETQECRVEIYDEDSGRSQKLSEHDFLGDGTFTMAALMSNPGQAKVFPLMNKKKEKAGSLMIRTEEMRGMADVLYVQFRGKNLANMDGMFGKSDPYVVYVYIYV